MSVACGANTMRILVIKLSSLGDLFHALPAVHCLKAGLGATIDWAVNAEYADLVRCFTDVDRVIRFHRHGFFRNLRVFLGELRRNDYDYVVDFQGLLKSAMVARFARGRRRVGPSFHREGSRLFYHEVAGERNRSRHAVEENLDAIRHLELPVLEPQFPVSVPEWETTMPAPRVAIVPSSRWQSKNWPVESFIAVGRKLWDNAAASMFVLGSVADMPVCAQVQEALGARVENMAGRLSVVEMCSVLARMDLVISNDSGPMHAAAALGVPVLAVFGPTDPLKTGPYGRWHHVKCASLPCRPCFERVCRFGEPRCLNVVTPDEAAKVALEMLKKP